MKKGVIDATLQFFMGIILVELVMAVLFYLSSGKLEGTGLLQLIVPLLFIALVLAFWFNSMAGNSKKDTVEQMKDSFAGVLDVGVLFVFAQMMTAALLTLTAAGGAATGYNYRSKRLAKREAQLKQLEVIDVKSIESK